jgi:hypothetical protein
MGVAKIILIALVGEERGEERERYNKWKREKERERGRGRIDKRTNFL